MDSSAVFALSMMPLVIWFIMFGCWIAVYILEGLGLMQMAKGRGLPYPWMAWIPFASSYLLGQIADDINARRGKRSSLRKILLGFSIGIVGGTMLFFIVTVFVGLSSSMSYGMNDDEILAFSMLGFLLVWLVMMVTVIIMVVFTYMAVYKIFQDYAPNEATAYLVLSILVSICLPILLFVIRNRRPVSMQMPFAGPYGGSVPPPYDGGSAGMYQNDAPQPPMTPNAWNGQGYGQPPQSYAQPTGSPYGQARPEAGVQGSWKPPAPPAEPAAPPVQPDGNRSVEQPPIVPHEMPPMQETPDTYADDAPQDDLNDHME